MLCFVGLAICMIGREQVRVLNYLVGLARISDSLVSTGSYKVFQQ